jgi:hypothetical protein
MGVWNWIKRNVDVDVKVNSPEGQGTISTSGATGRPGFSGRFGDVVDMSQILVGGVIVFVALRVFGKG